MRLPPINPFDMTETPSTVTTFGDSITAGSNASDAAHRWTALLAAERGHTLNNQGIAGTVLQNSADSGGSARANNGRDTFVSRLLGGNASAYYVIQYGTNDLRYTAAPATLNLANFIVDYREILNGLAENGKSPRSITLGSPPWFPDAGYASGTTGFTGSNRTVHEQFVQAVADLAEEYGTKYADIYTYMRDGGTSGLIDTDQIHPTDAGHARIKAIYSANTTFPNPYAPVAGLALSSPGAAAMTATWTADPYAVGTEVQLGIRGTYAYPVLGTGGAGSYAFTGLTAGKYRGRIRSRYADGNYSPWAFQGTEVRVLAALNANELFKDSYTNEVPATLLDAHPGDVGDWTRIGNSTDTAQVSGVQTLRGPGSASKIAGYYIGSQAMGSGIYGEAVLSLKANVSGGQHSAQIILRTDPAAGSFTGLVAIFNGQNLRVLRIVSGTSTTLGTYSTSIPTTGDHTVRFEVQTNAQRIYLDGSLVLTTTDPESNLGAMGTGMGIRFQTGSSGAFSDASGVHVKSLSFGTL